MAVYGEYIIELFGNKSAEDGAMTVRQANKYYKTILKQCRSKAKTEKQIDDCINTLNDCVKQMRSAKIKAELEGNTKERLEYALSSTIPLGSIIKLAERNEWEQDIDKAAINKINLNTPIYIDNRGIENAKTGTKVAGAAGSAAMIAKDVATVNPVGIASTGITFAFKYATYTKMLDKNINDTLDAINYLEKKKKEL